MTAIIQLTLDGTLILDENRVSLRLLGHSMTCIQSAVDRAYLDVRYGRVWKHARLPKGNYADANFVVGNPEAGSFKIAFTSQAGRAIVERLKQALAEPYREALEGGDQVVSTIAHQIEIRRNQLDHNQVEPQSFDDFLRTPDELAVRAYGDKSINKEFNQLLSPVRSVHDSALRLSLKPDQRTPVQHFDFNQTAAKRFGKVIGARELGSPVIYRGKLRQLDRGHNQNSNFKGKFINSETDRDVVIYIHSEEDFSKLVPYLDRDEFSIIACPVIEYSSFDPQGGDLQFIKILENER
ncbi:hypothetical protein ACTJK4_00415 [Ralstonia sp. 22111]|uniref:hypothetical protein n=1 Tax=Ralstonia sp. 22111 TaxID=3453878 RepID=UPI003F854FB0